MGESTPRQQPLDDQETGETREEANAEPGQDSQAKPDPSPAGDPVKKQGPQSKFHG
jgi:hypothetical protein